jgi:hypothetical protein
MGAAEAAREVAGGSGGGQATRGYQRPEMVGGYWCIMHAGEEGHARLSTPPRRSIDCSCSCVSCIAVDVQEAARGEQQRRPTTRRAERQRRQQHHRRGAGVAFDCHRLVMTRTCGFSGWVCGGGLEQIRGCAARVGALGIRMRRRLAYDCARSWVARPHGATAPPRLPTKRFRGGLHPLSTAIRRHQAAPLLPLQIMLLPHSACTRSSTTVATLCLHQEQPLIKQHKDCSSLMLRHRRPPIQTRTVLLSQLLNPPVGLATIAFRPATAWLA